MIKITPLRLEALKYANGESDYFPSPSVSRVLEREGLIQWNGYVKGVHHPNFKLNKTRGWYITNKGKEFITKCRFL